MKCPFGHDLTRPTKAAFRQTKVIDGVRYRAMDCRRCFHTFLTAELVVTPERAAALELTPSLEKLLGLPGSLPPDGTEMPAS